MSINEENKLENLSRFLERQEHYKEAEEAEGSIFAVIDYDNGPIELYDKINPEQPIDTYEDIDNLLNNSEPDKEPKDDQNVVMLDLAGTHELYDRRNRDTRLEVDSSIVVNTEENR